MESKIDGVSNDTLGDAAFELELIAHRSKAGMGYDGELLTLVEHLREKMDE